MTHTITITRPKTMSEILDVIHWSFEGEYPPYSQAITAEVADRILEIRYAGPTIETIDGITGELLALSYHTAYGTLLIECNDNELFIFTLFPEDTKITITTDEV